MVTSPRVGIADACSVGMAECNGKLAVVVGDFEDVAICPDGPNVGDRVLDLVPPSMAIDVWSSCSTKSGSSFEGDLLEMSDSMECGTILIHSKSSSFVLKCVVPRRCSSCLATMNVLRITCWTEGTDPSLYLDAETEVMEGDNRRRRASVAGGHRVMLEMHALTDENDVAIEV